MKRLKMDDTVDVVAKMLCGRPGITVAAIKEIAATVSDLEDRDQKRLRIIELADARLEPNSHPAGVA